MTGLLGERLEHALERLADEGIVDVRVVFTKPPRGGHEQGTPRVVRMKGSELLVARFPDEVKP